jgi:predicted PurR-regulated permease PerM
VAGGERSGGKVLLARYDRGGKGAAIIPTDALPVKTGRSDATPPKREYPTEFQRRMMWMAIAALSMLAIAAVVVYAIGVFTDVLQFVQPVLVPIAFAGILAYLLEPIVKKLTDRGTPRFRAMMLVWLGFHGLLLLLFLSVAVPTILQLKKQKTREDIVANVSSFITGTIDGVDSLVKTMRGEDAAGTKADETPAPVVVPVTHTVKAGETTAIIAAEYGIEVAALEAANAGRRMEPGLIMELPQGAKAPAPTDSQSWVRNKVRAWVAGNGEKIAAAVTGGLTSSLQGIMGLFGYLVGFVLVPLYLYYFLKESAGIKKGWSHYIPLRASRFKAELVDVLTEVNGYLIAFFRGQMLVSMIDGLLVGVSLALLGLPYAMLIGVFVALLGLIPYVGNVICWFAAVGISVAHFSPDRNGVITNALWGIQNQWAYPLIVTVVFVLVQKINSLVTAPKIVGDAVGLHPLTVIFSVLFWSLLIGGLLGALLAVPLTASLKVLFRRYIWEKRVQPQLAGPVDYPVS